MSEKALRKRQQHPRQVTRITEEQARAAVQRFANRHFNNPSEKSRASIPAAPDDDDILLMDYITQREAALQSQPEQAAEAGTFEQWWEAYKQKHFSTWRDLGFFPKVAQDAYAAGRASRSEARGGDANARREHS